MDLPSVKAEDKSRRRQLTLSFVCNPIVLDGSIDFFIGNENPEEWVMMFLLPDDISHTPFSPLGCVDDER